MHYIHEESGDRIRIFETNLNKPAVFFEKGGGNWTVVASKKLHKIHFLPAQDTTGGVRIFTMEAAESSSRVLDRKVLGCLGGEVVETVLLDQELDDL